MVDPIKGFGGVASNLARGPLGIIALFIVLVYGFAALVTATGGNLTPIERMPLIYFMISFPVVVLGVFAWLVSKHHIKLYPPSDFKDEGNFMEAQKMVLTGIKAQMDQIADKAIAESSNSDGAVTADQAGAAAKIKVEATAISPVSIFLEMDKLCIEYETIRRAMSPSRSRTDAMTRIMIKMRSLGPSAIEYLQVYKNAKSPGARLAAIAIMQMMPQHADLNWLENRFSSERPFIFYHAALALTNAANETDEHSRRQIQEICKRVLSVIESHPQPDRNTVNVLKSFVRYS